MEFVFAALHVLSEPNWENPSNIVLTAGRSACGGLLIFKGISVGLSEGSALLTPAPKQPVRNTNTKQTIHFPAFTELSPILVTVAFINEYYREPKKTEPDGNCSNNSIVRATATALG